jgi:steroid delta-isomerase-like uncharacterized protein
MKKIKTLVLSVLFIVSLSSSAQKLAVFNAKDANEQNADQTTAMAVSKAILDGDWAKLDGLLDENFTYTGDGSVYTKDQYIGFMQEMRSAFSDFNMSLEKSVVENHFVSIRFVATAVNTGKFMGAPATKKNLEVNGIFMRKIKDGKVMQEWQTTDLLGVMRQIGGGSLFFYSVFVGGFNVKAKPPVRKPNDFLYIDGKVANFDVLSAKKKNKYIKKYLKNFKKTSKKKS